MYENMNEGKKSIENSSPLYQTYTPYAFKNINLIIDHHIGGKWFIHSPNTGRRIVCLAWDIPADYSSLLCKSDIQEVHGNLSNPLLERNVHGRTPPPPPKKKKKKKKNPITGRWINVETISHTLIISCQVNTVECRYNAVQYCKILHKSLQELS